MHICLVTLDYPPFRSSGLTIYAEKVVRGIASLGHRVTVVAASRPESEHAEDVALPPNVDVVRLPIGRADWIGLGWRAARYLRSRPAEFDLIHFADIHFAYAYPRPFVATGHQSFRQRLSSDQGRTYATTRRDLAFRTLYYSAARWTMEWPSVRRARQIIMVSQATQQEFLAHYPLTPSRTTVVYTGIDLGRFEGLPAKAQARQILNLPVDAPIMLYVGFSTPRKGVEYLARALQQMEAPAHLAMVGKWEKHYQEQFVAALRPARSRVRIAGYVPDDELLTYFAAADLFVLPSLLEGFGIPLVEAMAAGLPLVTTTGSAATEIAGDAGLSVPPADSQALAAALDRVLLESELANRLRKAGRKRAAALFDERRMATDTEAVYKQALGTLQAAERKAPGKRG